MVLSAAMVPSVLVCVIYHEYHLAIAFVHAFWVCMIIGFCLWIFLKGNRIKLRVRDGFLLMVVVWLVMSVVGAVPYFYSELFANPVDAFFESVSGFTSTGVTVFDDVEALPHGLLFWRSFTQWFGALLILEFTIAFLPTLGINGSSVTNPDKPSVNIGTYSDKTKRMVAGILTTYFILSLAEFLLLTFGEMGVFDAMIHSMGTISTGGFSNYNDGIMHFASPYTKVVLIVFMVIGGTSFNLFYQTKRNGLILLKTATEFKAYLLFMVIAFALMFGCSWIPNIDGTHASAIDTAFQVASVSSTTGYAAADYNMWPVFTQLLMVIIMLFGACSSSCGSGMKIVRLLVLVKLVKRGIETRLHTNVIAKITLEGKEMANDTVSSVVNKVFLTVVTIFLGAFIFSLENIDMIDCFTGSVAIISNVGPTFGALGIGHCFADLSIFTKLMTSLLMIAGRMEIYAVLVLLLPSFWRSE